MTTVFRKEIKYVIYQHEFAKMRPLLSALMQRDTHGGDFGYVVRSLYFDSVYDRDYYDTVDGRLKKAKVRLRIYGKDSPIKLELKQKENSDSLKQSLLVTREEARCMQQCDYEFLSRRTEPVSSAAHSSRELLPLSSCTVRANTIALLLGAAHRNTPSSMATSSTAGWPLKTAMGRS